MKCEECTKQKKADNCQACYKAEKSIGIVNQNLARERIATLELQMKETDDDLTECEQDYAKTKDRIKGLNRTLVDMVHERKKLEELVYVLKWAVGTVGFVAVASIILVWLRANGVI